MCLKYMCAFFQKVSFQLVGKCMHKHLYKMQRMLETRNAVRGILTAALHLRLVQQKSNDATWQLSPKVTCSQLKHFDEQFIRKPARPLGVSINYINEPFIFLTFYIRFFFCLVFCLSCFFVSDRKQIWKTSNIMHPVS